MNPFSLENKTILVTGASSGIGKAIAIICSQMGANLIIIGRDEKRLNQTYDKLQGDYNLSIRADITNFDEVDNLINSLGPLDGVVHSAGIIRTLPFSFISNETLKETMDTNFTAPVLLTQKIIKKKLLKVNSSVIFIDSIVGTISTYKGYSAYSASKGALYGIMKTMALEFAQKKIRVNCISPGMIQTELLNSIESPEDSIIEDQKKYPLGGYGVPEDVAYASVYLLSNASKWITGINLIVDGGFTIQ